MALAMPASAKAATGGLCAPAPCSSRPPAGPRAAAPAARRQSPSKSQTAVPHASFSSLFGNDRASLQKQKQAAQPARRRSGGSAAPVMALAEGDTYIVELQKPYGVKFYKGDDGATYVDAVAEGYPAEQVIAVGDKVLETSAIFGDDMWPAAEYGRTMYALKNRIGILALKMEKKNGVMQPIFVANEEWKNERNAGNYGDAIREKQIENYLKKVELEEQREKQMAGGLTNYKAGNYEEALLQFETLLTLQPTLKEEAVASYNVACCYSKIGEVDAGLLALEAAMKAGFDDYKTIREDSDLTTLRESSKFTPLLNRYDEPFINENALKALTSVFGLFGGKK